MEVIWDYHVVSRVLEPEDLWFDGVPSTRVEFAGDATLRVKSTGDTIFLGYSTGVAWEDPFSAPATAPFYGPTLPVRVVYADGTSSRAASDMEPIASANSINADPALQQLGSHEGHDILLAGVRFAAWELGHDNTLFAKNWLLDDAVLTAAGDGTDHIRVLTAERGVFAGEPEVAGGAFDPGQVEHLLRLDTAWSLEV